MRKPCGRGGSAARRCPECGVESRAGDKYCDFCGMKVADETVAPAAAITQPHGRTAGMLKGIVVGCLAIGIMVHVGNRFKEQKASPVSPPSSLDGKRQASASCEAAVRAQVRAPFRVIAFRSALVAEERGRYAVSGVVELQSAAGEVQRRRYSCRVHPNAGAVMVLDDARLY